jgi:hypothetical protein
MEQATGGEEGVGSEQKESSTRYGRKHKQKKREEREKITICMKTYLRFWSYLGKYCDVLSGD